MGAAAGASRSTNGRRLLLAEDDANLRKSLARALKGMCELQLAGGCRDALDAIDEDHIIGVVTDLVLPDGDGFQIIEHARKRYPGVPALLITGYLDAKVAARAFAIGVTYLPKPLSTQNLLSFARKCLTYPKSALAQVEVLAEQWEARYHLTATERAVLVATARGMSRDELLASRGIAETTLKRHVTNLLLKTDETLLDRAALRFLREVLNRLD